MMILDQLEFGILQRSKVKHVIIKSRPVQHFFFKCLKQPSVGKAYRDSHALAMLVMLVHNLLRFPSGLIKTELFRYFAGKRISSLCIFSAWAACE